MSVLRKCFFSIAFFGFSCSAFCIEKKGNKPQQHRVAVKKKELRSTAPPRKIVSTPKKNASTSKKPSILNKPISPQPLPMIPSPSLQKAPPSKPQMQEIKKNTVNQSRLIVIDPGHGGYDLGARMSACDEKSLALSTALLTKKHLVDKGYRVILTRSRDVFMPLEKRTLIANETKSKLFVSIHFNAAKSLTAKGVEVFYYLSQDKIRSCSSKKLATQVLHKIIDQTSAENRGVKEGNFFVIRETQMSAILVEAGFMTHPEELHLLKDIHYRDKIAKGIAEGVDAFFK